MVAEPLSSARTEPLVQVQGLSQCYTQRRPLSPQTFRVQALDQVDLIVPCGSTVALVGESGSGKSALARCLMRLEQPSGGQIWFEGKNLLGLSQQELFPLRRQMQLILQDPASAFNPRLSAAEVVAEPLVIHGVGNKKEQREQALHLMEQVGLLANWGNRLPLELSGGQRQRLAIARALSLRPKFLILDEALSALDLLIQAQIVNLLLELQASRSLTYLFISHDLGLAGHFADEVAVIHRGRIVEHARTADLFTNPQHPQTQALLASMPVVQTEFASLFS